MVHLYHHSLIPSSSITCACVGNFSGTKQQEICVARGGQRIELLRTDAQTGKLESIVEADVFGQIRSLTAFKLTGGSKGEFADRYVASAGSGGSAGRPTRSMHCT